MKNPFKHLNSYYRDAYGSANKQDAPLGSIKDNVSDQPIPQKALVLEYLKRGDVIAASPGIATDVLTGERICGEELLLSDGTYTWMTDIIYYVEKYDLKLPDEFIEHVLRTEKDRL